MYVPYFKYIQKFKNPVGNTNHPAFCLLNGTCLSCRIIRQRNMHNLSLFILIGVSRVGDKHLKDNVKYFPSPLCLWGLFCHFRRQKTWININRSIFFIFSIYSFLNGSINMPWCRHYRNEWTSTSLLFSSESNLP